MNIAKNMEAIFVVAFALITVTGIANAKVAQRASAPVNVAAASAVDAASMTVVTVTGKRLSAAEKAAFNG